MLPLDHIRILDLSRLAPGPFCTMLLADLGADVIKIEELGGGRRARLERQARRPPPEEEARRRAHSAFDRNKRSITLDLKSPDGVEVFRRLARTADVVVEGFRPGVVRRLGVDYERLRDLNPRLVYCSISGYGQDGPYAGVVGHDINYIALAGALSLIGERDGPPATPGNLLGDFAGGGLLAAFGILAAVVARERTGAGQYVDIAMTDGVAMLLTYFFSEYFARGSIPMRGTHRLTGAAPYYGAYRCADDRYIAVGCNEPWFYENLCRALGGERYLDDQWAAGERAEEIRRFFAEAFRARPRDEWFDALRDHDVAASPVYTLDEAASDPQLRARGMFVDLLDPEVGPVRQVGIAVKLSETPGAVRHTAHAAGADTDAVLREAAFSPEEIARLRAAGAFGSVNGERT